MQVVNRHKLVQNPASMHSELKPAAVRIMQD